MTITLHYSSIKYDLCKRSISSGFERMRLNFFSRIFIRNFKLDFFAMTNRNQFYLKTWMFKCIHTESKLENSVVSPVLINIMWPKSYGERNNTLFHSQIPLNLFDTKDYSCRMPKKSSFCEPESSGKWKSRCCALLKSVHYSCNTVGFRCFFSTLDFFFCWEVTFFLSFSLDISIDGKFEITMIPVSYFFQVYKICCGVDSWFCHQRLNLLYAWDWGYSNIESHKCFAWNGVEYEVSPANIRCVSLWDRKSVV